MTYYFKSRPGVLWVLHNDRWHRNVIPAFCFEPDCITVRGLNRIGKVRST